MSTPLIPGLGPRDEIPRPNPGADPMAAGLTAQEGWVFSRVDGHTSFAELFHITGLGETQTVEILKSLVQRGLVLTRNGARPGSPLAGKLMQPIAKPTTLPPQGRVPTPVPPRAPTPAPARVPTPVPPSAPQTEVDRARAEARAAEEALASATRAREKAAAEEASANAAFGRHRESMDNAEKDWKQIEARREAARMAEEQARASVQALRDSLVRAEMELTKLAAERERIFRDTEMQSKGASDVRGQAGQAAAYADLATKARALADKEEETAKARLQDAAEALRAAEDRAHTAAEDSKRRAAEEAVRAAEEKQRAAARDLENLVKGYTTDEPKREKPREDAVPRPIAADSSVPIALDDKGDSDLPDEIRKRIMRKHVKLATQDLFELLDLPIECDKRDVKRAYFKLSKEFHPDRFFGKKLGAYKDMVGEVFRAISQAAEYLGDDTQREEYRAMIRSQREMKDLEESFAKATAAALEEQRTAVAVAQNAEAAPAGPAAEHPSSGFAASPAEARVSGSGKWARKGSGEYPVSPSVTPPVKPPSGSRLVQKMLSKKLGGDGGNKARKHFDEGNRQAEQEQWVSAMHNYKLAVTLAPGNTEYENKYIEAQARAAEVQAAAHAKRAEFEKSAGRFDTAARCYEAAIDAFATWEWCVDAVEMFLQIRELNKALEYGIKAVELDSASAPAHLALGKVYRERKQLIDAKRAIEHAVSLDPQNQEAKELLKEVGKSA